MRDDTPPEHPCTLMTISAADLPEPALCCQQAAERGYRRGYRHGYIYALWDLAALVRIPAALWRQIDQFERETLVPWMRRSFGREEQLLRQELGPRVRLSPRERRAMKKESVS